jgi:hypothetical protein
VDPLSKVLLGLIALSSMIQALVILALALACRQLFVELRQLRDQLGRDLAPVMGEVGRIAHNVAEVSESVAAQGRRMDEVVAKAADTVRETTSYLGRAARKSALPLLEIGALWQGAKRALQVYRRLKPPVELAGPHEVWSERQTDARKR